MGVTWVNGLTMRSVGKADVVTDVQSPSFSVILITVVTNAPRPGPGVVKVGTFP